MDMLERLEKWLREDSVGMAIICVDSRACEVTLRATRSLRGKAPNLHAAINAALDKAEKKGE